MAQLKQAKLTPEVIFSNQKRISEKLHKRALNAIKAISESYGNFVIKDDRDKTFLFNQVNYYYRELTHIIFNLQQILIDIGKNIPSAYNLEEVLAQLNMHTSSIQESLKLEPKKLKNILVDIVVKVGFQFEMLMKIVNQNDLHEHKQRILDCQLDFVIYTEKLKLNQQYRNVSFPELQKSIFEINANLISMLDKIKTGYYEVMDSELSHYMRIDMLNLQYIADYVYQLRNSGRLTGNLNEILKNVEKQGRIFINGVIDSVDCDNPIPKLAVFFENTHDVFKVGLGEMQNGLHAMEQQHFDLQELIVYLIIYGMNGIQSLNETLNDVATLKK